MAEAPDPIDIDSDDDESTAWQNLMGAMSQEPTLDDISCVLLLPQFLNGSSNGKSGEIRKVGKIRVTLMDSSMLVLATTDRGAWGHPELQLRVPTASILRVELRRVGRYMTFRLHHPVNFAALSGGGAKANMLDTFALFVAPSKAHATLSTLAAWMPEVPMQPPRRFAIQPSQQKVLRLEGTELSEQDAGLLEEECWLNDAVMNFFLRLAMHLMLPDELCGHVHLASTYFFEKLSSAESGMAGWQNVQRWINSHVPGGALSQSYIFLPINEQNLHWWLAVVCHPQQHFESSGRRLTRGEQPRIVCLDSADEPPPKKEAVAFLEGFLHREWMERSGDSTSTEPRAMAYSSPAVPIQENTDDCGIFVFEFVSHLLRSTSSLKGLGLASHRFWFNQDVIAHRRHSMRYVASLLLDAASGSRTDVTELLQQTDLREQVLTALTDQPASHKRPRTAPVRYGE